MEKKSNDDLHHERDADQQQAAGNLQNQATEQEQKEAQVSGDDIISKGLEDKHHQQHGNRKYQMFKNHSSADDQPRTDTGTP